MFPEFFDQILKYSFQWLTCSKYIDKIFKVTDGTVVNEN